MKESATLHPLGDHAILIQLGDAIDPNTRLKVQTISLLLDRKPYHWLIEYIPAFTTVTVFYDPMKIPVSPDFSRLPFDFICSEIERMLAEIQLPESIQERWVEIPVCYGGEFGPDLHFVAKHNSLTPDEVIQIHSDAEYLVHMIGFAPGFPYIGGLPEKIAAPRKENPRLKIPSGSVGIAGKQTGVYPIETPGGWQIIGRTPLRLFRPHEHVPSLLKAGDRIRFKPISFDEYMNQGGLG